MLFVSTRTMSQKTVSIDAKYARFQTTWPEIVTLTIKIIKMKPSTHKEKMIPLMFSIHAWMLNKVEKMYGTSIVGVATT